MAERQVGVIGLGVAAAGLLGCPPRLAGTHRMSGGSGADDVPLQIGEGTLETEDGTFQQAHQVVTVQ